LDSLAESIVNSRRIDSIDYTFRHAWKKYHDELLALRSLSAIKQDSDQVDLTREEDHKIHVENETHEKGLILAIGISTTASLFLLPTALNLCAGRSTTQ
jgi:hypothetical protein